MPSNISKEEAESQQRRTFARWVSLALTSQGHPPLEGDPPDLVPALSSGVNLVRLVASLVRADSLPRFNEKPKMVVQRNENCSIAIDMAKAHGAKIVNVGGEDVAGENATLTLGLTWSLIQRFQLTDTADSDAAGDGDANAGGAEPTKTLTPREALVAWINERVFGGGNAEQGGVYAAILAGKTSVSGLGPAALSDGRVLLCLVHSLSPGPVPIVDLSAGSARGDTDSAAVDRCESAVRAAENFLGVPPLVSGAEFAAGADEHSAMTYVSLLRATQKNARAGEGGGNAGGAAESPCAAANAVEAARPLAVGSIATFWIPASSDADGAGDTCEGGGGGAGGDPVEGERRPVEPRAIDGVRAKTSATAVAIAPGTSEGPEFSATVTRSMDLSDVDPVDAAAAPPLVSRHASAKAAGGDLAAVFAALDLSGSAASTPADAAAAAVVTIRRPGRHVITVFRRGVCVPGFPIILEVPSGPLSSRLQAASGAGSYVASGEGLATARTGESARFRVKAEGGAEPVEPVVTVEPACPVRVVAARTKGAYDVSYAAIRPGAVRVHVSLAGEAFPGSPFSASVVLGRPASSMSTVATRSADAAAPGEAIVATVTLRDMLGNALRSGEGHQVAVDVVATPEVADPAAESVGGADVLDKRDGTFDAVLRAPDSPSVYGVRAQLVLEEMARMKMLSSFAALENIFKAAGSNPAWDDLAAGFHQRQKETLDSMVIRGNKAYLPIRAEVGGTPCAALKVEKK